MDTIVAVPGPADGVVALLQLVLLVRPILASWRRGAGLVQRLDGAYARGRTVTFAPFSFV